MIPNFEFGEKHIGLLGVFRNAHFTAPTIPIVGKHLESFVTLVTERDQTRPLLTGRAQIKDILDRVRFVVVKVKALGVATERGQAHTQTESSLEKFAIRVQEIELLMVFDH